jgi:importin-5
VEALDQLASCLTAILKRFGDAAMGYMDVLMPLIGQLLDKRRSAEERRIGICVVDDILEYTQAGSLKYASQVRLGRRLERAGAASRCGQTDMLECTQVGLRAGVARQTYWECTRGGFPASACCGLRAGCVPGR